MGDYVSLIRPGLVDFYAQFIRSRSLVFDLGANVGERAAVFLSMNASVVCVEPDPECVKELERLYADEPKVSIVPMGVSNERGSLPFYHNRLTVMSTFSDKFKHGYLSTQGHVWDEATLIPVTTLDALLEAFGMPAFCKIDVEGYEPQVLNGLHYPIPALSFEFHQETLDEVKLCINRLAVLGVYKYNFADGESFTMGLPRWVTPQDLFEILRTMPNPHYRPFWGGDIYAILEGERK